jgi:hypothetical protein
MPGPGKKLNFMVGPSQQPLLNTRHNVGGKSVTVREQLWLSIFPFKT